MKKREGVSGGLVADLRLIHLPIHASWLNQIEIYFSVIQRKVLSPNDLADLDVVEHRMLAFQSATSSSRPRSNGCLPARTCAG